MTEIFKDDNGFLNFSIGKVASSQDCYNTDQCVGSFWESLNDGEILELKDGLFKVEFDNSGSGINLEKIMYRIYCDPCFET